MNDMNRIFATALFVIVAIWWATSIQAEPTTKENDLTYEEKFCIDLFVQEFKNSPTLQKVAADSPFSLKVAMGMMAAERCSGLGRKK